ncbi:MAG: RNA polymerase factor sigma-54 [Bacteroidales bacterium]|nr:RNA polymerase factor sigma-54 [Bacteroidales bacterium]MBQ2544208.1 RNA polymerase factor sigma-54 [Bacteroidales bacterium]
MLKTGLELKQQQRLSPLQIQTIKLIQMPIQELEQKVRAELESNPVLDDEPDPDSPSESKDVSIDAIKEDGDIPAYRLKVNNWGKDPRPEYNTFSVKEGFTQSLQRQLGFRNLTPRQQEIGSFIIGSLDDDGYLRRDIDTLVDDLAFRANIEATPEEVEQMLRVVQEFEPVGVGARNLQECLLLQLRSLRPTEEVQTAIRIIDECFQDFSNKHFQKICTRLGITEDQLKAAFAKIVKLNPSPGGQIDDSYDDQSQQIVPDFILDEHDGVLDFTMPRFNVPEIRVNKKYADLLIDAKGSSEKSKKEAAAFVKQKLDSAKWFVEALKQRQNTLSKTMRAILEYQHDYFIDGDESNLKPMVLKDIAEKTGFDISTISRVVNSKFIETHFGIFPLKYFFSEGMENSEGEEVSTRELKKVLQECVDSEDKKKPLTDEQLVVEMSRRGYNVARRTIAKYRSQLGIPLARWRKEI